MNYNVNSLLAQANAVKVPVTTTAISGGYSFGIVCSASNGKRVSFSKALSKVLALEDRVYIAPVPAEGVLLVSAQPITEKPMEGRLNRMIGKPATERRSFTILLSSSILIWASTSR